MNKIPHRPIVDFDTPLDELRLQSSQCKVHATLDAGQQPITMGQQDLRATATSHRPCSRTASGSKPLRPFDNTGNTDLQYSSDGTNTLSLPNPRDRTFPQIQRISPRHAIHSLRQALESDLHALGNHPRFELPSSRSRDPAGSRMGPASVPPALALKLGSRGARV